MLANRLNKKTNQPRYNELLRIARCFLSDFIHFLLLKRLVFFRTQQGMFSAARNELSRFKLDVRRNMARYVLSNSKLFGLLPKTLPHSANLSLQSRDN